MPLTLLPPGSEALPFATGYQLAPHSHRIIRTLTSTPPPSAVQAVAMEPHGAPFVAQSDRPAPSNTASPSLTLAPSAFSLSNTDANAFSHSSGLSEGQASQAFLHPDQPHVSPPIHAPDFQSCAALSALKGRCDKPQTVKHMWTVEETQALVDGCNKHGVGNWKAILSDESLRPLFGDRTAGDLKDRFRTYFPDAYHELYPNAKTHLSHRVRGKTTDGKSIFEKGKTKERRPFSHAEDEALKRGYDLHGSHWALISKDPIFDGHRRSTDLRDRFRNAFPSEYEKAGYKPRPAKTKKERRQSSGAAAALQEALATLPKMDGDSARPASNASNYSQSASGDVTMSDVSDGNLTDHEVGSFADYVAGHSLARSSSIGSASSSGPYIRPTLSSAQSMPSTALSALHNHRADAEMRNGRQPRLPSAMDGTMADRAALSTPSRRSLSTDWGTSVSSASSVTSSMAPAGPNDSSVDVSMAAADYESGAWPTPQHPKSASMEDRRPRSDQVTEASGKRRSQSSKRSASKIGALEGMTPVHRPTPASTIPTPADRPAPSHRASTESASGLPWLSNDPSAADAQMDLDRIIQTHSASELLNSPQQPAAEIMQVDNPADSSSGWPTEGSGTHDLSASTTNTTLSSLFGTSDFTSFGVPPSNQKPRTSSDGQGPPRTAIWSSTMESFLDPLQDLLDPVALGSSAGWNSTWNPTTSSGPNAMGTAGTNATAQSSVSQAHPFSHHRWAGDLHHHSSHGTLNDDLPGFVDLASMQLPSGTSNAVEELLKNFQATAEGSYSATQTMGRSVSIHGSNNVSAYSTKPIADHDDGGRSKSQDSVAPTDSDIQITPSIDELLSRTTNRRSSNPLRPTQGTHEQAYRTPFAADDLSLSLGSQTLFTPPVQLPKRRRSNDTLRVSDKATSFQAVDMDEDETAAEEPMGRAVWPVRKSNSLSQKPPLGSQPMSDLSEQRSEQTDVSSAAALVRDNIADDLERSGPSGSVGEATPAPSQFALPPPEPHTSVDETTYAASLPDTSHLSGFDDQPFQQHSYDDIDLPSLSFLQRSPSRLAVEAGHLPRSMALSLGDFNLQPSWGAMQAESHATHVGRAASETNLEERSAMPLAQKAMSEYAGSVHDGVETRSGPLSLNFIGRSASASGGMNSPSLSSTSSLAGWNGGPNQPVGPHNGAGQQHFSNGISGATTASLWAASGALDRLEHLYLEGLHSPDLRNLAQPSTNAPGNNASNNTTWSASAPPTDAGPSSGYFSE